MLLRTRDEAKAQGLTRYFTGKPCKHGHICERCVRRQDCVECKLQRARTWREKNPEEYRAKFLFRNVTNRDRSKESIRSRKIRDMIVVLRREMPELLKEFGL